MSLRKLKRQLLEHKNCVSAKNTTSKIQLLDAGIIANWKVKYKKRLLRYVCGQIDVSRSASEIVKSVSLLMSIEWGRQAWYEVSADTIQRWFKKTGLFPEEVNIKDDPFEGEDLQHLQYLLTKVDESCSAEEYISVEDDLEICGGYIDSSDPYWRETFRDKLLGDNAEELPTSSDIAIPNDDESRNQELNLCRRLLGMPKTYAILRCITDLKN